MCSYNCLLRRGNGGGDGGGNISDGCFPKIHCSAFVILEHQDRLGYSVKVGVWIS